MNLLFVCSRNQWRSPTAEEIYKKNTKFNVASAGTSSSAKVKLCAKHLTRADLVFVMEKKHKEIIKQRFPNEYNELQLFVLDVPDVYKYMDKLLIEELEIKINAILSEFKD